jgi:hypothetical protein
MMGPNHITGRSVSVTKNTRQTDILRITTAYATPLDDCMLLSPCVLVLRYLAVLNTMRTVLLHRMIERIYSFTPENDKLAPYTADFTFS